MTKFTKITTMNRIITKKRKKGSDSYKTTKKWTLIKLKQKDKNKFYFLPLFALGLLLNKLPTIGTFELFKFCIFIFILIVFNNPLFGCELNEFGTDEAIMLFGTDGITHPFTL